MMKRWIAAVVLLTWTSPVFADGLNEQAQRALAQQLTPQQTSDLGDAKTLKNAGLGLMAGGLTLTVLSWSALKHTEGGCFEDRFNVYCYEDSHTNWPLWTAGMGAYGGGLAMWLIGKKRQKAILQPMITHGGAGVKSTVRW